MYYTIKYHNQNSHCLDKFETKAQAVKSAKALHHPDWPVGEGIKVKDSKHRVVFDSGN